MDTGYQDDGYATNGDYFGPENPIFSFAYHQRQPFIDEIGLNVYTRIRNDQSFIHEIGASAANAIKNELGDYIRNCIRSELNDYTRVQPNTISEQVQDEHDVPPVNHVEPMDHNSINEEDDPIWSQAAAAVDCWLYTTPPWKPVERASDKNDYPAKLDFTLVRQRKIAPVLCNPFQPFDVRGVNYKDYLKKKTGLRNVGVGYGVDASFFKDMTDMNKELDNSHIDAYLGMLYTNPKFGNLRSCNPRITVTSTAFLHAVHQVWQKYHKTDELSPLDPGVEEMISREDLYDLAQFVTVDLPKWGIQKPWINYDKVVVVHMTVHWVTCCINLKESTIIVYDSTQHEFNAVDYEVGKQFFIPFSRLLPQVLRYSGFYDDRTDLEPRLTQWNVIYPDSGNLYMQNDGNNCGAYALKYVESILTGKLESNFDTKALKKYKVKLSESLFAFSTDEDTICNT